MSHVEWVIDFATSLQSDGIDVVLDQWDLREGEDPNVFMERIVSDETIDRILMVCDSNYATKADKREGGVGTESQIISSKIYSQVGKSRFVAIVRERDESNQACVPIFYGSRMYIDMTDSREQSSSHERLIRWIFDKPLNVKPPLGKPPAYITNDDIVHSLCVRSSQRFVEALLTGRGNPAANFDQFARDLLADLQENRLSPDPKNEDSWPDEVLKSIESMRCLRDALIDVLVIAATSVHEAWFEPALLALLEKIAGVLHTRPTPDSRFREVSLDNLRFFAHEAFLSVIAVLISKRRFRETRALFDASYFVPEKHSPESLRTESFDVFHDPAHTLEETCNKRLEQQWISYTGNLIFQRATHSECPAIQLIQGDAIALLVGIQNQARWPPTVSIHGGRHRRMPLFDAVVATGKIGGLGELLSVNDAKELLAIVASEEMKRFYQSSRYWRTCFADGGIYGVEELQRWVG